MSWILFGVIFTLIHTSRHRTLIDKIIVNKALTVDASPIPPNGNFFFSYFSFSFLSFSCLSIVFYECMKQSHNRVHRFIKSSCFFLFILFTTMSIHILKKYYVDNHFQFLAKIIEVLLLLVFFSVAPYLKPINPYIRHWEAARFDAKLISNNNHYYGIKRRKRYTNDTLHSHDINSADTIKFQFFAHNR